MTEARLQPICIHGVCQAISASPRQWIWCGEAQLTADRALLQSTAVESVMNLWQTVSGRRPTPNDSMDMLRPWVRYRYLKIPSMQKPKVAGSLLNSTKSQQELRIIGCPWTSLNIPEHPWTDRACVVFHKLGFWSCSFGLWGQAASTLEEGACLGLEGQRATQCTYGNSNGNSKKDTLRQCQDCV